MINLEEKFIEWAGVVLGSNVTATKEKYGDQSSVYRICTPHGNYFMKIAQDLKIEREKLDWLNGKLSVPKVIEFTRIAVMEALLLSAIEGKNLAELKKEWVPEKVVNVFAEALLKFHTTPVDDCPFGKQGRNRILVHGDACLPNFIFHGDVFSGYVDLGDMRIDVPETDLSAAIWSLHHNLGSGYGLMFLEKYGAKDATEESVEKLRLQYEEVQRQWGLL